MSYDFLILAPGTQYHPPVPTGIDPKVLDERRKAKPCEIRELVTMPEFVLFCLDCVISIVQSEKIVL